MRIRGARAAIEAAALAALAAAAGVLAQAPPSATFVPPSGSSLVVRSLDADGRTFVSVNDVVAALGGSTTYDASTRSFESKLGPHSAVYGTEAPLAVVDTKLVALSSSVRAQGAAAFADLEFFQRVCGPPLSFAFAWDPERRLLSATRNEVSEIGVEATVVDVETTTKVVFRFTQPPSYAVEKGDDQVVLHVVNARLAAPFTERNVDDPRVARLLVKGSDAAVVLKQKGLVTNVYPLGSPPRIVVDVSAPVPAGVPSAGDGPPAAAAPPPAPPGGKTVVLDPGHGGTELGAKGADGLLEKDATLAFAKTVREVLTRRGYHVVLTRESDASVGLEDRAAAANAAKADVFLSLHANASRVPSAHGTEVYYLSLDASDRLAAAVAESENKEAPAPTPDAQTNAALRDLDLILWDLAQNQHLSASSRLADILQGDFNRLLGITTRGVKQAPFKVLIGVNAPAVLVEVAFITNPDEERKLSSEEFRRQAADTIAGSLDVFFRRADAVAPVPYAPKAGTNGRTNGPR